MDVIHAVFGQMKDISPGQECARAVVIFLYGYVVVRLLGRRVFGRWAALDIIVSIIIGSNLSRIVTGTAALGGTLGATSLMFALHWVLAQAAARWPAFSHLIEGRPAVLAKDGEPQAQALHRWSISEADINEALRSRGLRELKETQVLLLEPSGKISILKQG